MRRNMSINLNGGQNAPDMILGSEHVCAGVNRRRIMQPPLVALVPKPRQGEASSNSSTMWDKDIVALSF
jgi:hypothetical protein